MDKILFFSAVRKDPEIVRLFLKSAGNLLVDNFELDYLIYDDNSEEESSTQILKFIEKYSNATLLPTMEIEGRYTHDHGWNSEQIDKVTTIKNSAMKYALSNGYDYIFLVDADIVMNKETLKHLYLLKKDIVAEVFWTKFFGESYYKPNAWDRHSWAYDSADSIIRYKEKGTYTVGCTGACTLISSKVIEDGISFSRLRSLPYPGEDRHFCTRAQANGYELYLDTNYPVYHIFLTTQVNECESWYELGAKPEFFKKWLNINWEIIIKNAYKEKKGFFQKIRLFIYQVRRNYRLIFKEEK